MIVAGKTMVVPHVQSVYCTIGEKLVNYDEHYNRYEGTHNYSNTGELNLKVELFPAECGRHNGMPFLLP